MIRHYRIILPRESTSLELFNCDDTMYLLRNEVPDKIIYLNTSNSIETSERFSARVDLGKGKVILNSDLPGLQEATTAVKLNQEK